MKPSVDADADADLIHEMMTDGIMNVWAKLGALGAEEALQSLHLDLIAVRPRKDLFNCLFPASEKASQELLWRRTPFLVRGLAHCRCHYGGIVVGC